NQENDYSFNPDAYNFVANKNYTVYHNGVLCWGREPKHRPQITAGENYYSGYYLELAMAGELTEPLAIELNGKALTLSPSLLLNWHTIYWYHLSPAESWAENNFLRCIGSENNWIVTGARLTKRNYGGEILINSNGLTDPLSLTNVSKNGEEYI